MFRSESFGQRQFFRASRDDAGAPKGGYRARVIGAEKSRAQNSNPQH